jgi:hypothetical protein
LEIYQLKYIYDKYDVKVRFVISWKSGPGAFLYADGGEIYGSVKGKNDCF